MGPITLLDKSSLQKFSEEEIWKLFKHYTILVPPVLIHEILADLTKKGMELERAKGFVKVLANKLCPMDCKINTHFRKLCIGSLLGHRVPMAGQIILDGGDIIEDEKGEKGVFFDEEPVWKDIRKWQRGDFTVDEVDFAEKWRAIINRFDLESHRKYLDQMLPSPKPKIENFEQLCVLVNELVLGTKKQYNSLLTLMNFIAVPVSIRQKICWRWEMSGVNSLEKFAPYAFFCFYAHMLFNFGLYFRLLGTKPSNFIDLEYLFYAPFCMVFSSGDNFHHDLAPLLLRNDQAFVDAGVLKNDLGQLIQEWNSLSDTEKKIRSEDYGCYPPQNDDSITHQLWKRFMRPWTPGSGNLKLSKEDEKRVVDEIISKVKRWEALKEKRAQIR